MYVKYFSSLFKTIICFLASLATILNLQIYQCHTKENKRSHININTYWSESIIDLQASGWGWLSDLEATRIHPRVLQADAAHIGATLL